MGSFAARTQELGDMVGHGKLTGRVSYGPGKIAGPQHLGGWITGPLAGVVIRHYTTPGTGPEFLSRPLLANADHYMRLIAQTVLDGGPRIGMEHAMLELREESGRLIPKRTERLERSGDVGVDG